ncbi:MAG TPA: hypothetical protein PKV73_07205 [Agriterribacter sp.]|nr:hypothetical protein [Chitinophagaceae bacterium]HRP31661.1 hypothetical protein [Agriterribacter sp.]
MKYIGRIIKWKNINIPLLIFLVLFLNVKLVIKLVAIVFIVAYSKNLKFGDLLKTSRFPLFYALIILIEPLKYLLITRNFSFNYATVFCLGMLQWGFSLIALYYIKIIIEKESVQKVHNTIKVFFTINFLVSLFFLSLLLFQPSLLTFWNHGSDISFSHPSAGDAILGVSFDASTVNAAINCMGLLYFIYRNEYKYCLICLLTIALCTSNVSFLLVSAILSLMFVTVRTKKLRLVVFTTGIVLVLSYLVMSPNNRQYIRNYFVQLYIVNKNPEILTATEKELNFPPIKDSSKINIDSLETFRNIVLRQAEEERRKKMDSVYSFNEKKLGKAVTNLFSVKKKVPDDGIPQLVLTNEDFMSKPGKLISFFQTYNYLTSGIKNFIFGSGTGNFSSKLAFRASGVNIQGTYPAKYQYISPEFRENHLKTFSFYFNGPASLHSVINYPFSVYNQLPGEYGFLGVTLFAVFYLGFFLKRFRFLTYGRYMIPLLLAFLITEYWLELYSLVVMFELFMFLNIKENEDREKNAPSNSYSPDNNSSH